MNESQISVRYAKALFQSASENRILDRVYSDMELVSETCRLDDFMYMLVLPSLQGSQKSKVITSIFEKHLTEVSVSMINLVIKNKREVYLPGIARYFRDLYRKVNGIRSAALVTVHPVDESAMKGIKDLITQTYDSDVELTSTLNKDLIGGFVLTIEDMQYDASVATNLKKIKKRLLQTNLEKK